MAEPPSKTQKVICLRGKLPYLSHSALAAVCRESQLNPLPDADRNFIRHARNSVAKQQTPYGPMFVVEKLPAADGGDDIEVSIINPPAYLWAASHKKQYAALLSRTAARHPPSPLTPWHILLYTDEVTPGNVKKADNHKKTWAVYWAFLEFGGDALAKEDFWGTAATTRTSTVHNIEAGIGAIIKLVMRKMLIGPQSFSSSGINLTVDGRSLRVFAVFCGLVADEAAIHAVWMCKGAAGTKLCLLCLNIVNKDWIAVDLIGPGSFFKAFTTVRHERDCVMQTRNSIFAIIDELRLAQPTMGVDDFKIKQRALGFSYSPEMVLVDPELRAFVDPSTQTIFDWPHSTLQGTYPLQLSLLEQALRANGVRMYALLEEYLEDWHTPGFARKTGHSLSSIFNERRRTTMEKNHSFTSSMSEVLSIHAIIAEWLRTCVAPTGTCAEECRAYDKLSILIHMLTAAGRGTEAISPDELQEGSFQQLEAYAAVHPTEEMIPKHHHGVHWHRFLRLFGWLPQCLPLERKHKTVKLYADAFDNTSPQWDANILCEVTFATLMALDDSEFLVLTAGLHKARKPPKAIHDDLVAKFGPAAWSFGTLARFSSYGLVARFDIVAVKEPRGWSAAKVLYLFDEPSIPASAMVETLERIEVGCWSSTWKRAGVDGKVCMALPLSDILECLTWRDNPPFITVLHSWSLRSS